MLITLTESVIDAVQWTGDNDDQISAHLGREDWRVVKDVETQPGWWLYLNRYGAVAQMSDEAMRNRRAPQTA